MIIVIPGAYNAQIGALGNVQGQTVTIGSILKVTERDRRPYPTDPGVPSEIWIDNTAAIGYICKEVRSTGTVWDRLDLLGDYIAFGDGDPGSNNDITRGYRPGSLRYARNTQTLWICDDNTQGAAIWSVLAAGALTLQTNGLPNGDQTLLNIVEGTNMTITDDGFGNITFDATGGGGTYTVNNGLTESPANNFQLGGATLGTGNLVRDTYITNDGYVLRIDQINPSTNALDLRHSGTGLNTGVGLRSQAGGIAVRASSSENWAFEGVSVLDYTAALLRNTSSTNDAVGLIKLVRNTSGIPSGDIGGSIDFWIEARLTGIPAPGSPTDPTVRLAGIWEVPGPAVLSRLSRFDMYGYSNGGTLLNASVRGDGKFVLYQYGVNTFAGTPAYALGVDAVGNVVEFTPSTGGTYTVNNGLSAQTVPSANPNNFQLGGNLVKNTTINGVGYTYDMLFKDIRLFRVNSLGKSWIENTTFPGVINSVAVDSQVSNLNVDVNSGTYRAFVSVDGDSTTGSELVRLISKITYPGGSIGFGAYKIEPSAAFLEIRTPNVNAGTATVGQVLALSALTGEVEYINASGNTYTVDNGLTQNPTDNFQLGSTTSGGAPLLHDTYIDTTANHTLYLEGQKTSTNDFILDVDNSTADGGAIRASAVGNGNAIRALSSSGSALAANSTGAPAISATTGGSTEAGLFVNSDTGTNNIVQGIKLRHSSSGVPAPGFGVAADFTGKTTLNSDLRLGRLIYQWTDPVTISRTSKFQLETVNLNAAAIKLEVDGPGQLKLNNYGQTPANFPGTPVWSLGVDASGNVVEFTSSPTTGDSISPFLLMGG